MLDPKIMFVKFNNNNGHVGGAIVADNAEADIMRWLASDQYPGKTDGLGAIVEDEDDDEEDVQEDPKVQEAQDVKESVKCWTLKWYIVEMIKTNMLKWGCLSFITLPHQLL